MYLVAFDNIIWKLQKIEITMISNDSVPLTSKLTFSHISSYLTIIVNNCFKLTFLYIGGHGQHGGGQGHGQHGGGPGHGQHGGGPRHGQHGMGPPGGSPGGTPDGGHGPPSAPGHPPREEPGE